VSVTIEVQEQKTGIYVLSVQGEVDMSSSTEVRQQLAPLLDTSTSAIIVHLVQVSYMDSSGIATLVEGLQQSMKSGISFRLAELSDAVQDIFKLARLDSVFSIYPTITDAMNEL